MKKINFLISFLLLFSLSNCFSQQLVKTENNAYKIKANQNQFINKPLSVLIKEIKPPIRRVTAAPSKDIHSRVGYFIFNFVDSKQKDSLMSKNKIPITIVVYVKEKFEWDFLKRAKGKETVWTADDLKKYSSLTIVGFRVYGDSSILD